MRHRRLAAIFATLALAMAAPIPGFVAQSEAAGCVQVAVFGVAGSGQGSPTGAGAEANAVMAGVQTIFGTSATVAAVPVIYPAVWVPGGIGGGIVNGVSYTDSRQAGVEALQVALYQQMQACPGTRFVLTGYSQGADVIGLYINDRLTSPVNVLDAAVRNRVAAVALMGDPRFNPGDGSVVAGNYNPTYGPIFGKFGIPPAYGLPEQARTRFPAPFNAKTVSACNAGDLVCNYSAGNAVVCAGAAAWKVFLAAVAQEVVATPPTLSTNCAHLRYVGGTIPAPSPAPGTSANTSQLATFAAAKTRTALKAPLITTLGPVQVAASTPVSTTMAANGGTTPYRWTATGLPAGLALSTGGVLSGSPTTAGTYLPTFTLTDANTRTSTQPVSVVVAQSNTAGTVVAGGTIGNSGGVNGTSFIINTTGLTSLNITGPPTWNGGSSMIVPAYRPSGIAASRGVWWAYVPPVSGTYTASATVGGAVVTQTFSINATNALTAPVISNASLTSGTATVGWTAVSTARSFMVRVAPAPWTGIVTRDVVVSAAARTLTLSGLPITTGGRYEISVWALSDDVATPGPLDSPGNVAAAVTYVTAS